MPWAGFELTILATNRPRPTPQTARPLWPAKQYLKIQFLPQRKHNVSIRKISWLMLFKQRIAVCSDLVNTLWEKCSYWVLKQVVQVPLCFRELRTAYSVVNIMYFQLGDRSFQMSALAHYALQSKRTSLLMPITFIVLLGTGSPLKENSFKPTMQSWITFVFMPWQCKTFSLTSTLPVCVLF
jgi:hypothetical protein